MSSKFSKNYLTSECLISQIIGALIKWWWLTLPILLVVTSSFYIPILAENQWCQFGVITGSLVFIILVCNTLTDIFSLRKQETKITWCQICILFALGAWIICILLIFNITDKTVNTAAFGIVSSILAWIFQDTIRGVVAFIHLRLNHLLQIDDWIKVPKYDVNGKVTRVTLTTVTLYNWDTTTSSIPTSALLSDHFINMQKMADGKTYGRKMSKSFILDTGSFYVLSKKDTDILKSNNRITKYLPKEDIHEDITNAQLYRQYLFHWLMKHSHVSQKPLLMVSWQKHTESGMTLQMNAFIIDSDAAAFEWQQSLIVEHIIQSLDWFGLRLYQSPSSYDTSSSTIYIADKPLTKRTEE